MSQRKKMTNNDKDIYIKYLIIIFYNYKFLNFHLIKRKYIFSFILSRKILIISF